jgi:uncharacterized short protein YbdD (DUF466 family)
VQRAAELLAHAAWVIRRVLGAPDYERYLAHLRHAHPGTAPLSREAFLREAMARKFEKPGGRCC